MRYIHPARARFRALIRQPEPQINLAEAALCVAWEDQGVGHPAIALRELDGLAEAARPAIRAAEPTEAPIALSQFLFDEVGFHGNTWNYSDPANSFLDRVLEARAGLPITLTIVYLEVGWRLALPVSGLALPGHFLARYAGPGGDLFVDPFNRGRLWSRAECVTQIATFYGAAPAALVNRVMEPPTRRAILARLLRNLKNLYSEREAHPEALAALDRILLLEPDQAHDVRDRGLLRARLGQLNGALEDLERYARIAPSAPDLAEIRLRARALARQAATGN
jgi:regulator of sirC expression with transglutaminase-like and TPR domain